MKCDACMQESDVAAWVTVEIAREDGTPAPGHQVAVCSRCLAFVWVQLGVEEP
jgi:hypothetical protein